MMRVNFLSSNKKASPFGRGGGEADGEGSIRVLFLFCIINAQKSAHTEVADFFILGGCA